MPSGQHGFWSELLLFVKVYLSNWQSYATGGVVTGLISVGERLFGKPLPKKAYFLIFVVSFSLAAFFLAWRDEFRRADGLASSNSQLSAENGLLKQTNGTLTSKLMEKERPIILQATPDPQIEKLLRRQDEELAKLKNSLPSPKKRALQVSTDLLKFLTEREKAQPSFPMPRDNTTREEFTKQQDGFEQAYLQWMNGTATESQARFAIPLAQVLEDMKAENIDTGNVSGFCTFFNGNTFGIQNCATGIGVLAQKLSH
jgi:hypothetical protein